MKKFIKSISILGLCLTLNFNLVASADVLSSITENTNSDNNQITESNIGIQSDTSTKSGAVIFSDITGHWAESKINQAVKLGFVSGYQDGTFKPDKTVTRAEFATLLNNAMKNEKTVSINMTDVKKSDWFYNQVQKSVAVGFFSGYENNTFRPNNPITRQEVAKVISGAITTGCIDGDGATRLKDYSTIQDWAKPSVNTAYNKGYIMGYPNRLYLPVKALTRAEAVKIIYEILDNENIEHGFNITNYNESYSGAVVVGDLNVLETVGTGKVYITNVTVLGDINIYAKNINSVVITDVKAKNIVVEGNNNPVKITCNSNIYVDNVKLSSSSTVEKLGTNIQIKNTVIQ